MLVDTNDYAIARRGTEERILEKEKRIMEQLRKKERELRTVLQIADQIAIVNNLRASGILQHS